MHCETTVEEDGVWEASWHALEKAYAEGWINSIGVSNFDRGLLDTFNVDSDFSSYPHVVQNWAEPGSMDRSVLDWCEQNEVVFQVFLSVFFSVFCFYNL